MSLIPTGGGSLVPVGARLTVAGENEFHRAFKAAGSSVAGFADLATTSFKGIGSVMTLVGGGILAAAGAAVKGAAGFESAMRNVQTISKEAQGDFEGMSQSVMDVARDTNQAGQQAAEGLYQIVSSGFDGAAAIDVLRASSIAAAAGLTDVFTSATAVASVLNSYGLAASESADISDILFQTVNFGVGSFEELAQAVPLVTGLAAQAKIPFDETAAAIAAASRAGLSFADASVGVSRIIQELLDPSDALQAVLAKVGYQSGAAALEQDGFRGVLEKIRAEVGGNTEAYVQMFGRIEGIRLALALAVNDGKAYAEATEQIANEHNRAGAAAKAYAIQQKATEKAAGDLANSLKQLGQSALTPLLGLFRRAFEGGKMLVDLFDRLPPAIKAGAGIAAIFAGALMLLVGAAFVALPRLVIIAILTFIRYNQSIRDMIVPTLEAAAAHDVLARAMLKVFTLSANTGLIGGLAKSIGLVSAAVAVASAAMIFLSGSIKNASEWVGKLQTEMTNAEMTKAAKDWERAWTDGADNVKQSILQAMSTSMVAGGPLIDLIPGANKAIDQARYFASKVTNIMGFSLGSNREAREEAEKGFKELARTNIEAARRMLDSAMAAGANGAQIAFMTKEIREAEKAAKDSGKATEDATSAYVDSAGQVLMVSEDIKSALDDFRQGVEDIQGAFGGIFADPTQEARDLVTAVRDAHDATLSAEADLEKARATATEHTQDRARKIQDAERDLASARRAAAHAGRTTDDPTTRVPEPVVRRKDESEIDFQKRVAEAAQRSAEIRAKAADTIANRQDAMAGANDRVRAAEERLADARAGTSDDMDQITEAEKRLTKAKEEENKTVENSIVTGEKLQANLKAQVNALLGFYMNLESLKAKGAPRELISELAKLGPAAGKQIEALAKMDPSALSKYFQTWRDSASAAAAIELEKFDPLQEKSAIAAKLAELWTMVGGDVGKFLLLGAGAGDEALHDFVTNKINAATGEAKLKLAAMIPPEYRMSLKIEIDTAAAKSAVEQAKVWGGVIANVLGLGKPLPAPPPPGAPTTGLPGLWAPPVVANPGGGFFSGMPGGGIHAQGTITKGPEVALIGEAGAEAVIPLTKPKRALQLMRQAGLDRMIAEDVPHRADGAIVGGTPPTSRVASPASQSHSVDKGGATSAEAAVAHRPLRMAEGGIFGESMSIPVASTASKDPTQKKWRDYAIRVSAYAQLLDATKIQQTMQRKFITRVTERVKDVEQDRQLVPRSRVVHLNVPNMAEGGIFDRIRRVAGREVRGVIDLATMPYDPRPRQAVYHQRVDYGDVRDPRTGEILTGDAKQQAIERAGKPRQASPTWLEVGEGAIRAPIPPYRGEQSPMYRLAALSQASKMALAGAKTLDFDAVARWASAVRTQPSPYVRYAQALNETRLRQAAQQQFATRATAYAQAAEQTRQAQRQQDLHRPGQGDALAQSATHTTVPPPSARPGAYGANRFQHFAEGGIFDRTFGWANAVKNWRQDVQTDIGDLLGKASDVLAEPLNRFGLSTSGDFWAPEIFGRDVKVREWWEPGFSGTRTGMEKYDPDKVMRIRPRSLWTYPLNDTMDHLAAVMFRNQMGGGMRGHYDRMNDAEFKRAFGITREDATARYRMLMTKGALARRTQPGDVALGPPVPPTQAQNEFALRAAAYAQTLERTRQEQARRAAEREAFARRAADYARAVERNRFLHSPGQGDLLARYSTHTTLARPGDRPGSYGGIRFQHFAGGSILKQAQTVIAGEAGAEAIIPITKPRRALTIMREAGLDQLVIREHVRNQRINTIEQRMPVFAAGGIVGNSAVAPAPMVRDEERVADRRTIYSPTYKIEKMQLADWRTAKRQLDRDDALHRLGTPRS